MKRNFIPMVMLLVIAAIFALRYLTACKRPDYRAESRGTLPANAYYKEGSKRFVIERIEVVTDDMAYNDRRGVYLIRDTETGQEYFGVSGIGITELGSHHSGRATHEDEQ